MLLRPTDDELLRVMIQIPLMKRRRIHGIEQLVQIRELDLDETGHEGWEREGWEKAEREMTNDESPNDE
jgi:hypothetical protein